MYQNFKAKVSFLQLTSPSRSASISSDTKSLIRFCFRQLCACTRSLCISILHENGVTWRKRDHFSSNFSYLIGHSSDTTLPICLQQNASNPNDEDIILYVKNGLSGPSPIWLCLTARFKLCLVIQYF